MSTEFYWTKGFPKEFWLSTYEFESGTVIARMYLTKRRALANCSDETRLRKYKFVEIEDVDE